MSDDDRDIDIESDVSKIHGKLTILQETISLIKPMVFRMVTIQTPDLDTPTTRSTALKWEPFHNEFKTLCDADNKSVDQFSLIKFFIAIFSYSIGRYRYIMIQYA